MNRKDLTLPENFSNFLGSFWTDIFDGGTLADGIGHFSSHQLIQLYKDLVHSVNSTSIDTVPVYKRESVVPVVISKQDIEDCLTFPTYGSGIKYGRQDKMSPSLGDTILFGLPYKDEDVWFVDLPIEYNFSGSFPIVALDRLYNGSLILINGVDFFIKGRRIVFKENPFLNPLFPKRLTRKNGKDDQEIVIWLCEVDKDKKDIFRNFGNIFSRVTDSSNEYKSVCKNFLSLVSEGANLNNLDSFLSASAGSPMISSDKETIIDIHDSPEGKFVETDKNLYKIRDNQVLKDIVVAGETFNKNFAITSAVSVIDPKKNKDWWRELDVIPAENVFSDDDITSLSFKNEESEVLFFTKNYGGSIGQKTFMRFNVLGNKKSIDTFWKNFDKQVSESNLDLNNVVPWHYALNEKNEQIKVINPADFFLNYIAKSVILPIKIDLSQVSNAKFLFSYIASSINKLNGVMPVYLTPYIMLDMYTSDTYPAEDNLDDSVITFHRSPIKSEIGGETDKYTGVDTIDLGEKQFAIESVLVKYRSKCSL